MLVMPDVEEPFVPLGSDGLFVDPYESRAIITDLLQRIPRLFAEIKNPEPALLSTLDSCIAALSATGGKIVCSLSSLPTWGPGRLFMRDEGKLHGIESEKKLFQTEHSGWKKTAGKMVESGIGVDFFVSAASGGYMDLATIGRTPILIPMFWINEAVDRSYLLLVWWRNVLLSQLRISAGQRKTHARSQAHNNPRYGLPSINEGAMLQRATSLIVSRELPPA